MRAAMFYQMLSPLSAACGGVVINAVRVCCGGMMCLVDNAHNIQAIRSNAGKHAV